MNLSHDDAAALPALSPASSFISLALSGGNALGAYAAGACAALHEAGYSPDLVSGASIGAVNAAIVAGNPPAQRAQRLREFWRQASVWSAPGLVPAGGRARDVYNKLHAMQTVMLGRPGLFTPRSSGFLSLLPGTPSDVGLFDGRPLLGTLERVVDFDYLNSAALPLVIGCVDLESGEPVYFDSRRQTIEPRHVLASTAFIPGFPPVEIDGRLLGDPGMLCNLPLDPLLGEPPDGDHVCFAVDLFDARGGRPFSMDTALERAQDIAFASQSLRTIDAYRREYRLRHLLARQTRRTKNAAADAAGGGETAVALLAYRPPEHEVAAKTLEFSASSVQERWAAGQQDMRAAVAAVEAGRPTARDPGFAFFDCRRPLEQPRPEAAQEALQASETPAP
ncbi:patatin-like phospholipase family protein [Azohydromonas australica]|uniref:patatin-like phospholipase family protein n=1 Tax=Azohydromonas australica TaxID=364039 RepID=UPI00040A86AB|nr:patatin-like phospholipase family protein [Azohydromonas australica]